ncbi:putative HTH-type transcriptional regulator YbiH [Pandoraea pneumonica]|uniref:Putative HTH-type transcriptional regulator YbiH n=1 Tax=Pandoraea pneumonica TaxID=2508299 RepID=A0A5E4YBV5_9BURK|nr:CerR family C-terminal domain-containing protein [Pandoraea pneumonica]VVE46216.1 putative HTH-type transcriptional regulator YbiH [Pandoraea pneumonica]
MARTQPQTQRAPRAAARPRHAVDTGYQRGEETRGRIILAAIKCFGEHGFAGASTRDIANEAGVNAPALQYYFDNKEGVYTACVEYIVELVWKQLGDAVMAAEAVLADASATDKQLIDAFCALQNQKAGFLEDVPQIDGWHMFMAREQAGLGPDAGFKVFHERVSQRIAGVTGGIVARLCGTSTDDELTLMRAVCISTTGMAFRVMGRSVNCSMGWTDENPERNRQIRAVVVEQTRDMLELLVKRRKASK